MKTKHTPEPWHVEHEASGFTINQGTVKGDGLRIAYTASFGHGDAEEANAELISLAPELLSALNNCIEHMEWTTPQGRKAFRQAHAVLKRAQR